MDHYAPHVLRKGYEMEEKKIIEFRNIVKNFDGQIILKGINLDIYEKEFVTLLGPSGCGKTTLLRILGGFLDADEGQVLSLIHISVMAEHHIQGAQKFCFQTSLSSDFYGFVYGRTVTFTLCKLQI